MTNDELAAVKAENTEVRSQSNACGLIVPHWCDTIDALLAEVERLRSLAIEVRRDASLAGQLFIVQRIDAALAQRGEVRT